VRKSDTTLLILRRPAAAAQEVKKSDTCSVKGSSLASLHLAPAASDATVEPDTPARLPPVVKPTPVMVRQLAGHGLVAKDGVLAPFLIRAVCGLPSGRVLTGGDDGSARISQASTGESLASFPCHSSAVLAAVAFADGLRVLTTGSDGTACVWNVDVDSGTVGSRLARLEGHDTEVVGGAVYPGGERAITVGRDGSCRIWDVRTERLIAPLAGEGKTVVAVFPDGEHVAVAGETGRVEIWSSRDGKLTCEVGDHEGPIRALAIFPCGEKVLTAGEDGRIVAWAAKTGEKFFATGECASPLVCVAISHDGARILAGDAAGQARLLKAADGSEICTWQPLTASGAACEAGRVFSVAFLPDDATTAMTSGSGGARVWRLP